MRRNERRSELLASVAAVLVLVTGCGGNPEPEEAGPPKGKLMAGDGQSKDSFGAAVAISGDTAIIGAVLDDEIGEDSGSAYIFVRGANDGWSQQAKLVPSDGGANDQFGFAVAISGDTAIVGAPNNNQNGAVYVFERTGYEWAETAKIVASDGAADDQFGYAVASDGDRVVVGAPAADPQAIDSGAAYAFTRASAGWSEQGKLLPSSAGEASYFGVSVALSELLAIVGAWDDGSLNKAGAAYVYSSDGSTWSKPKKLVPSDAEPNEQFGSSVAIDGAIAIVGAPNSSEAAGPHAGSAYAFVKEADVWTEEAKITAAIDGQSEASFGWSVAISNDLTTIGAYWDDENGKYSGSAYLFNREGGSWTQRKKFVPSDGFSGQVFGCAVAMTNLDIMIGAYGDGDQGESSGAAYHWLVP